MNVEHMEEYLGAIYRLRENASVPLPLPRLQDYLNYTLISVHEMVRKLEGQALASYVPYRGVVLTGKGEQIAASLVRRHRIWERFLADKLAIPWEATHAIAGQLEHAAPDLVTERLAGLMGEPELCPHGSAIPPRRTLEAGEWDGKTPSPNHLPRLSSLASSGDYPFGHPEAGLPGTHHGGHGLSGIPKQEGEGLKRLSDLAVGDQAQVTVISPEVSEYLCQLQAWGIIPGTPVKISGHEGDQVTLLVNGTPITIPVNLAQTIWTGFPHPEEPGGPSHLIGETD
jgi:Mn-dependent DtxR family transcriptional regulator